MDITVIFFTDTLGMQFHCTFSFHSASLSASSDILVLLDENSQKTFVPVVISGAVHHFKTTATDKESPKGSRNPQAVCAGEKGLSGTLQ